LLVASIIPHAISQKPQVWMLGPMLHFNISQKKMHPSFGIELSYWNYAHYPYSIDGAIEFEKKKIRIYSEAQTGIGVLGFSLGPVIEFRTDEHKVKLGAQGSMWANYFGGFDVRLRMIGGHSYFSPGLYFKIPLGIGESDGHYHHHSDWDWDD
jgi:hypothetical protein